MSRPLSFEQVRALRLRAQRLAGRPCASASEAVASVIGVQAQAIQPAQLAVRARSTGLAAEDVTKACHADRSLVRTWLMRGTLHLVAAADVHWLLRLLGPRQAARDRRRRQRLGLDDRLLARSLEAIPQIMAGRGPLAREELVRRLARQGVVVDLATQASAHLVLYAALQGVICMGPETRGNRATYVLLDEWLPAAPTMEPEPALAELARRYLAGYGPATPADLAAWSGLPIAAADRGFRLVADETEEVEVDGRAAWRLPGADPEPRPAGSDGVRLLGHWDPYLLGYRWRDPMLDAGFRRRVWTGGGFIRPVVLAAGRVVGTWRRERRGGQGVIRVEPFVRLDPDLVHGLEAESADLARFLGEPARLEIGG
ncbi:MAG TPA: winged helix DNA-binding domain-containing protein [Candidatus Dormibacteraeota bacterium]|nr:winged helix DNA-binding domain-containing protein [Candidatus Dormibacteraeota bacterium]